MINGLLVDRDARIAGKALIDHYGAEATYALLAAAEDPEATAKCKSTDLLVETELARQAAARGRDDADFAF